MPRFRAFAVAFAWFALAVGLTGCSSRLDDQQIHKTIDARTVHGKPLLSDLAVAVNPFEYTPDPTSDHRPCAERKYFDDARLGPLQKAMDAAGLLIFQPTGDCTWSSAYTPLAQADFLKPDTSPTVVLSKLDSFQSSEIQQTGNDATATLTIRYVLTPSGTAYVKSGFPFPHNGTACTLDATAHTDICVRTLKFHYAGRGEGWIAEI